MWRSVLIELSTCHKVHLPPQFGLSRNPLPRGVLCESQQDRGFGLASPGQELRTVDGPLSLYGARLDIEHGTKAGQGTWKCSSLAEFVDAEQMFVQELKALKRMYHTTINGHHHNC